MFDSIATLFSTPILPRHYELRPSLQQRCARNAPLRHARDRQAIDKESEDVIDSLAKPIETWIIQKQPHLKCAALNQAIFAIIADHARGQPPPRSVLTHNLFVLIVQYRVLNERIRAMECRELQVMLDGLCSIYLGEEKGPFDELTCLLHFVISNCRMHECDSLRGSLSLFRALDLRAAPHFFTAYAALPTPEFIDAVVNIVPMMTELCRVIVKTDHSAARLALLERVEWLGGIGVAIMETMRRDVQAVMGGEEGGEVVNPCLRKRLFEKGSQLVEIEGIISSKVLFSFAYKELYYFQHALKLHKYLMEMALASEAYLLEQQRSNLALVSLLLQAVTAYEFNLPDTSIQSLGQILSVSLLSNPNENPLFLPDLNHPQLQEFIEDLKCSPLYQPGCEPEEKQEEEFQFYLQKDESIVSCILEMVFSLKLEYLQLLRIILEKTNKNYLENLQFYLIRNGLLHFLVLELEAIQSSDKKSLENYFRVLALLLQRNSVAYCLLHALLQRELRENDRSALVEHVRKNFVHSKELLFVMLADTITANSKRGRHFVSQPLRSLLYLGKATRHDVWISYIHDVVLRELRVRREKGGRRAGLEEEAEWTMLAVVLQVEYLLFRGGGEVELGEFTMAYLTNMLKEAIKWKYEDETSLMKKLLATYQQWEAYYAEALLAAPLGEDLIEKRWGPTLSFPFLRKWNKKICRAITLFIESVANTAIPDDLF